MPWLTPTLSQIRQRNRDYIESRLGSPLIPNSDVRILADANGGNAHLNLQYLDWLSLQLLPDTAETLFLDKWATLYLVNADGSLGRKAATYASGSATATGTAATVVPRGTQLSGYAAGALYETIDQIIIGDSATPLNIRCLDAGAIGNADPGTYLSVATAVAGLDAQATVTALTGGTDQETDDELRVRVLARIRQPPMGGDANDYVNWALSVAGVTRAWCSPNEVGTGTVTVRIMCDDLRASTGGLPAPQDLAAVRAYIDTVRPVTVKQFWVVAPIPQPIDFEIKGLVLDNVATRAAIRSSVQAMLRQRAAPAYVLNGVSQPAQTIYAAWISDAIFRTPNVRSFDLIMPDAVMPNDGSLAVLGTITYD